MLRSLVRYFSKSLLPFFLQNFHAMITAMTVVHTLATSIVADYIIFILVVVLLLMCVWLLFLLHSFICPDTISHCVVVIIERLVLFVKGAFVWCHRQ